MGTRLKFSSDYILCENQCNFGNIDYIIEGSKSIDTKILFKKIKPGIFLSSFSLNPGDISGFDFELKNAPVEFTYFIKGKCTFNYKKSSNHKYTKLNSKSGMNFICNMQNMYGQFDIYEKEPYNSVGIYIDPDLLRSYLEPYKSSLYPEVKESLFFNGEHCMIPFFMTPQMEKAAWEIMNSPYTGISKELFLESKALELIALQLESIINYDKKRKIPFINKEDIDKLYNAKNILIKNLDSPPSIAALSRMAGLNEFKLKKGFKEIFNTTVFGYLRRERMKKAHQLILEGSSNVGQIAYNVGYSNVSHFISSYKKEFGLTPGEYIKKGCIIKAL